MNKPDSVILREAKDDIPADFFTFSNGRPLRSFRNRRGGHLDWPGAGEAA